VKYDDNPFEFILAQMQATTIDDGYKPTRRCILCGTILSKYNLKDTCFRNCTKISEKEYLKNIVDEIASDIKRRNCENNEDAEKKRRRDTDRKREKRKKMNILNGNV